MKKLISLSAFFILCYSAAWAQYVNIPDNNFRNFLQTNYPGCMNSSGQLDTTCGALLAVEELRFGGEQGVYCDYYQDMEGIQYFKNLQRFTLFNTCLVHCPLPPSVEYITAQWSSGFPLPPGLKQLVAEYSTLPANFTMPASLEVFSAQYAGLTSLPALPASLKVLDVSSAGPSNSYNSIRNLPTLPAGLKYLNCQNNFLTSLPELPSELTYLNCSGNYDFLNNVFLTSLPALPPLLDTLDCANPLSQMPSLPSGITYLRLSGGTLTSLPTLPPGLKNFRIEGAQALTSMPALPGTITDLFCYNTVITSLPALPAALKNFSFEIDTMLTTMPDIPAGVEHISCYGNRLTAFPALPAVLKYLDCSGNRIAAMPSLPAGLLHLNASGNKLTSLPVLPASLNWLTVNNNQLTTLPELSNSPLKYFTCNNNNLTVIPTLPATLRSLYCNNNQLTALPAFTALDTIVCNNNNITALPASNAGIIMCHNNFLTELPELNSNNYGITCYGNNIYCLPRLPQTGCPLQIITDTSKVRCLPNTLTNGVIVDYRQSTGLDYCGSGLYHWVDLPLCNPTNNIGNCHAYPIMSGVVFYDNNRNGTREANEPFKQNVKVLLQNNEFTFTDANGYFELFAPGIGNTTALSVIPVRFYTPVPASSLYNFTSFDTTVFREYAMRANIIKDSMAVALVPLNWAARPGFSYPCAIQYENIGSTNLNPVLTIHYDDTKLIFDSSSVPMVNNVNSLTLSATGLVPGQKGNVVVYFRVKPDAPLGAGLTTVADIVANSFTYTDSISTLIGGSFDPNDKQATPQLSPLQVANGEYIKYTVRFQNTGTDTAFNIIITDTLNIDLQVSTLQMLAASHNCNVSVKGNVIYFEFHNILLPDSNINEPKSHGFVLFRIKPRTNVAENTNIPNSAAIYFDYNAPVITNTATTLIKEFTVVPLQLVSFSAVPQNDNFTTLYWNTANEINTKHFVIERGNDGLRFSALSTVFAKGKANNNYNTTVADINTGIVFYRLKMVDNDGSFTYSPIIKIDKRKTTSGIQVLSNPAKDHFLINTIDKTLTNTAANIINMQGTVVKTFILKEGIQTVDIIGLPKGMYYLRTVNGSNKLIVQ